MLCTCGEWCVGKFKRCVECRGKALRGKPVTPKPPVLRVHPQTGRAYTPDPGDLPRATIEAMLARGDVARRLRRWNGGR